MKIEITVEEYLEHTEAYDGVCLACGEFTCGGVEPDASGYECPCCDEMKVMGTEEALMLGYIWIAGDDDA